MCNLETLRVLGTVPRWRNTVQGLFLKRAMVSRSCKQPVE